MSKLLLTLMRFAKGITVAGVIKTESDDYIQTESGAYLAFDEFEEVIINV